MELMKNYLKMKVFKIIIVTFLLTSCNLPKYYFKDDAIATGVDFTKGKWLLNRIESSKATEEQLTKKTTDFFKEKVGNRFSTVYSEKILVPQNNKFLLDAKELKQIKTGSNYDYFIQVKSGKTKNELGVVDATPKNFNSNLRNEASIQLIIYDLNTQQLIYSKHAYGIAGNPENNSNDITLTKSSTDLLMGCLQKILKDLDKKSIQ